MADFVVEGSGGTYFVAVKGVLVSGPHSLLTAEDKRDALERQAKMRERPCMCCYTVFISEGVHNRLCKDCRPKSNDTDWMG